MVQVKVGTFTSDASPKTISGLPFAPKLVLIYSTTQNGFGAFKEEQTLYIGAAISGSEFTLEQASRWENFVFFQPHSRAGLTTGQTINDTTMTISVVCRATCVLNSDGFTLTFSFRNADIDYNYVAIGGDDVTVVMGQDDAPTSAGTQSITGVGFQPNLLFLINGWDGNDSKGTFFGHGWVDTYGRQGVTAFHQLGDQITDQDGDNETYQRTNKCLVVLDDVTGAVIGEASHVSHDADGFTLNWTDPPPFSAAFKYIAVGGLTAHAGALTHPTSPGVQPAIALNCKPEVVFFQSSGGVAGTTPADGLRYTLGFATETNQGAVWSGDDDAITSPGGRHNTSAHWNDRCIVAAHPTGASSGAIDASATLTDLRPDSFEITWGTVDAIARQVLYLAIGQPLDAEAPGPPEYDIVIGDETGIDPLLETFRIQETLDGNTTLVCDIDSAGSPLTRFTLNDSVVVTENDIRIFGGVVTGLRERAFGGENGGAIVVEVQATSYAINAKRRYLTQSTLATSSMTLGEWLTSLIATHLGAVGVTLHDDQADGPTLEALTFERTLVSEAIDKVAESIGYLWSIDFYNRLRVWAPGDVLAPEDLDESTTAIWTGDVGKEEQLAEGYANHVTIVGEGILIPDWLDEFVGNSVDDTFDLTYKVVGPYPYTPDGQGAIAFGVVRYTDGSTESIGGLESPIGFIWEYDPVNLTIRRRSGPVASSVDFEFPYHGLFEPNATALDAGEIATYGLWEHVESVTAVPDDLSAQGLADAILAKKLASKDEFVTYQTRDRGYHPGQFQNLIIPSRVVSGDFLITQVETFAEQGSQVLVRQIKCAKSLNNDADWRKVYRKWYGVVGSSSSSSTTSVAADSGAGAGLGLHAEHHQSGGIDPIKLDDLATPDDNTDLNVSTSRHGLAPKITGSDGDVLTKSGTAAVWATPAAGGGVTTGVTLTNNQLVVGAGSSAIKVSNLTGDVTTAGGVATTIANDAVTTAKILNAAVTLAKIANAAANSKLVGSGASGSGAAYSEITLGTNLSMSGTTLNVAGGGSSAPTSTAHGSEPGSPITGDLDFYNNSFYIGRYSGSLWAPWGPIFPMTAPISGDFAWINQGSASLNTTPGGIYLLAPATGAATPSVVLRKKAAPSTPYTITVSFIPQLATTSGLSIGCGWRQSSDGKLIYIALDIGGAALNVYKFNSATSFNATYAGVAILAVWPLFVRFTDNGTNRIVSWSRDGQNFLQIHSVGRTDFLTANEVFFGAQAQLATGDAAMTLLSWKET